MAFLRRAEPELFDGLNTSTGPHRSAALPALPSGGQMHFVQSAHDLNALRDDWLALEQAAGRRHQVFQSFGWLNAWTRTYRPDLHVVTGYVGSRLVFLWPLMRTRLGPLHVLRWLSDPSGQYGDILVAPDQCARQWMAAVLPRLKSLRGIDIIRLRHVRDDAAAAPFLSETFRSSNLDELAPSLDLTAFADEAAYEARYTATQRKRRRKIRKALEDDCGPVAFEILKSGPLHDRMIREAIAEKCAWVDTRGRHNRILACPLLPPFLQDLGSHADSGTTLMLSRMTAGDKPVSWEIGLRYGKTHFCYITSHVDAFTNHSPARLHMDLSQRKALADGMTTFDLMVPNDSYKDSWCSQRMPAHDWHLPLTPLGRLYGTGYLQNIRPALRSAYHHAPPALLRMLKPVTGH